METSKSIPHSPSSHTFSQKLPNAHSAAVTYGTMGALLVLCPPFVVSVWYTMVHLDGSIAKLWSYLSDYGMQGLLDVWPKPTMTSWKLIAYFCAFEALLMVILPGETFRGPVSPTGNRPVYKKNGFKAYAITMAFYCFLWRSKIFNPCVVYDHLGEILSALIIGSFFVCVLLYLKGYAAPSSTDWGSSGNILIDFFWGMELYPRLGKHFDIKTFTNCRFGMMSWAVLVLTYCIKQYEMNGELADSMMVSAFLMLVYITKFFFWESGYLCSMDIAHDRAGFYIVWGCMVWVPSVYTSPALYLVKHPVNLGVLASTVITLSGLLCIYINYEADIQRQTFRNTGGKTKIWGKLPSKILAHYVTENGEQKQSLLLTSGWWGVARHFHYLPEIAASFFWSLPALFNDCSPYFYTFYLTLLLLDRAHRDDQRCRAKYQKYWEAYCQKVRYSVVPGLY